MTPPGVASSAGRPAATPSRSDLVAGGPALAGPGGRPAALVALDRAILSGPDQEARRERLRSFVVDHADALDRTCRPGHLTGSALVVEPAGRRTLVLWHRKLQRWLQPGGHADGDGNLARVAWREATEETGIAGLAVLRTAIHLDVHEVAPPGEEPHLHLDVRHLVVAPPGARARGNHESEALRWVPLDGLAALGADDGLLALAEAGAAALDALGRP